MMNSGNGLNRKKTIYCYMLVVEDNGTYTMVIDRKFPEDGIDTLIPKERGKRESRHDCFLRNTTY
jgi:hypothetical protein